MIQENNIRFRWLILGLLFTATAILYIDRGALGILAPVTVTSVWSLTVSSTIF